MRHISKTIGIILALAVVASGCSDGASDSGDPGSGAGAASTGPKADDSNQTSSSPKEQLFSELNRADSPVRAAILAALASSCYDDTCYAQQVEPATNNTYTFGEADLAGLASLGESIEDSCPKSVCDPAQSGYEGYAAILKLPTIGKWGHGVSPILVEVDHGFEVSADGVKQPGDWTVSLQTSTTLPGAVATTTDSSGAAPSDPSTAEAVAEAREGFLAELNNPESPVRKSILATMASSCVDDGCYADIGGPATDNTYTFSGTDVPLVAYLGDSAADNCPKEECTPQVSGSHAYVGVVRIQNIAKWGSAITSTVVQLAHQYDTNFDSEGLESSTYTGWQVEISEAGLEGTE